MNNDSEFSNDDTGRYCEEPLTRSRGPRAIYQEPSKTTSPMQHAGVSDAQTFMQSFFIHSIGDKSKSVVSLTKKLATF